MPKTYSLKRVLKDIKSGKSTFSDETIQEIFLSGYSQDLIEFSEIPGKYRTSEIMEIYNSQAPIVTDEMWLKQLQRYASKYETLFSRKSLKRPELPNTESLREKVLEEFRERRLKFFYIPRYYIDDKMWLEAYENEQVRPHDLPKHLATPEIWDRYNTFVEEIRNQFCEPVQFG